MKSEVTVPWLALFVLWKLIGTAMAPWSWWWVIAPFVPVIMETINVVMK